MDDAQDPISLRVTNVNSEVELIDVGLVHVHHENWVS